MPDESRDDVAALRPSMSKPSIAHVGRADADDAAVAGADEPRTAAADELQRPIDDRGRPRTCPARRRGRRRRGAASMRPAAATVRGGGRGLRSCRGAGAVMPAPDPATASDTSSTRTGSIGDLRRSARRSRAAPGEPQRRQRAAGRTAPSRYVPALRVRVDLEVRDLLVAEHRRREPRHLDGRRRRQVVPVAIQLVAERPQRERAEVDEQHRRVDAAP